MSPAEALARRAVAAPGWRWLPGMVDQCGWRVLSRRTLVDVECVIAAHEDDDVHQWWRNSTGWHCSRVADEPQPEVALTRYQPPPLWLPDLADPATLGCLLALVQGLAKAEWDAVLASPSGIRQVITIDANGYSVLADRRPPTPINDAYTRALSMLAITSDSEALHQALAALVAALEAAPRRTP